MASPNATNIQINEKLGELDNGQKAIVQTQREILEYIKAINESINYLIELQDSFKSKGE